MLGAKKITSSDIAYAIPRRNWSNNTVYDMYKDNISSSNTATSGASNLFDSEFYFVTSDFRVYKVLDNNGGTAYSGSEPTSESTSAFELGGYVLKYMYKITASQSAKYVTTDYIPVFDDSTVTAACNRWCNRKFSCNCWFRLYRRNILCSKSMVMEQIRVHLQVQ